MGKQQEIKASLAQTEKEVTNQLGFEQVKSLNLNFKDEEHLFKSVSELITSHTKSSSIYNTKSLLNNYTKTFNKARSEKEYLANFLSHSKTVIVVTASNPSYKIKNNMINIAITDKWNNIINPQNKTNTFKSIGRIEHPNNFGNYNWSGTGWLYGNNGLVITNAHVAEVFTTKNEKGEFIFKRNHKNNDTIIQPYIDFIEEEGNTQEELYKIKEICYVGDQSIGEDIAIFRLDKKNKSYPIGLILETEPLINTKKIFAIGYPTDISKKAKIPHTREYFNLLDDIFKGEQGKKRISPGEIISYSNCLNTFKHNCSTLNGNSGSPLINPYTDNVVGMHYAGDSENYEYNMAISAKKIKEILTKIK